jgi:hypothetical protein
MTVTAGHVAAAFRAVEPDYERLVERLGTASLPFLLEIVEGSDMDAANKAVALAAWLDAPGSEQVVAAAAASDKVELRAVAALALARLTEWPNEIGQLLLKDQDPSIRFRTIRAIGATRAEHFQSRLREIVELDPSPLVRAEARRAIG